jgi:hypothetical protein
MVPQSSKVCLNRIRTSFGVDPPRRLKQTGTPFVKSIYGLCKIDGTDLGGASARIVSAYASCAAGYVFYRIPGELHNPLFKFVLRWKRQNAAPLSAHSPSSRLTSVFRNSRKSTVA